MRGVSDKTTKFVLLLFSMHTFSVKLQTMRATFHFIAVLSLLTLFSACKGETENTDDVSMTGQEQELIFKGKEEIEAKIAAIDNDQNLLIVNSLMYAHSNGSTAEAVAYLNEKQEILKIEEKFNDSKTGNFGKKIFYFENGKRLATKEIYQDNQLKKPMFIERVSFYDKKDKVQYAQQREADFEENLEMATFQLAKATDCPKDRAMQILNQEGPFETTFQGLASNGDMDFIIVGENAKDGFTSSLAIQHNGGDIPKLLANEVAYIGRPLTVQFERVIDHRDFEFQALMALRIN
jgi:hypothetical protein